jgi:nitroreductase
MSKVSETVNDISIPQPIGLAKLIRSRRSIAAYKPDPLPDGLIESLLETAVYTPNHRLTEPWRFIHLTGDAVQRYAAIRREMALPGLAKLSEVEREKAADATYHKFAQVPLHLVVALTPNRNPEIAEEDYAACAALIQNLLLLAWEQGIGSAWKTFKNDPRLRTLVGLQSEEKVVGIVQFGYPAAIPTSERQPARERITYIR